MNCTKISCSKMNAVAYSTRIKPIVAVHTILSLPHLFLELQQMFLESLFLHLQNGQVMDADMSGM